VSVCVLLLTYVCRHTKGSAIPNGCVEDIHSQTGELIRTGKPARKEVKRFGMCMYPLRYVLLCVYLTCVFCVFVCVYGRRHSYKRCIVHGRRVSTFWSFETERSDYLANTKHADESVLKGLCLCVCVCVCVSGDMFCVCEGFGYDTYVVCVCVY